MVSDGPSDIERLVYEALAQLGWKADAATIAAKLQTLDQGLPREDEFSVVCSWLGRCVLIHKLDQTQTPVSSRDSYQVPDLLAVFKGQQKLLPVLIEVKSKERGSLSFRPDYLERLKAYAGLLNLPLLVAWKRFGLWTLFDVDRLQKAERNFNISFPNAIKESLLGILAGDFSYSLNVGSGIHLQFRKEQLLVTVKHGEGFTEEWKMICDDVYFTGDKSELVRKLPKEIQALFLTWDLEEKQEFSDTHVTMRFVAEYQSGLFAHMALVRLLSWQLPADDKIDWRDLLSKSSVLQGSENFHATVQEALKRGIVHHVLHIVPHTLPKFLAESN